MYRNGLLTLHIASAAAWLGANATQLFLTPWFAARGGEAAVAWFEATERMARRYYNAAGAVLTVTGVLLVLHADYDWSAGFIAVGFTVIVVGAALGVLFFARAGADLAARQRAGTGTGVGRYLAFVALDTTLVLVAVLAMVDRWQA